MAKTYLYKIWFMWLAWLAVIAVVVAFVYVWLHRPQPHAIRASQALVDSVLVIALSDRCQQVTYTGFTAYYDSLHHWPACVTFVLDKNRLNGTAERSEHFTSDDTVRGCLLPDAYAGSGFHRGHLAPAADMKWSQQAMDESFMMTNICPQHPSLNEGGWALLEDKCREWVRRDSILVIFAGPIPDDKLQRIGNDSVPVPERFFKIVVAPGAHPMRALAFIYPNGPCKRSLAEYASTLNEVEQLTGIDFLRLFSTPFQKQIESRNSLDLWLH